MTRRTALLAGTLLALLVTMLLGAAAARDWDLRVCADPAGLPYSNEQEQGFENRIAEILADELHAELHYVWRPHGRGTVSDVLREGGCDLVMGVADGDPAFETTLSYYRSSYVFVHRDDAPFEVHSLDDPVLNDLRIGVHVPIGDGMNAIPPAQALANRGLIRNLVGFRSRGSEDGTDPVAAVIDAVARGEVDLAVAWGPIAGYFAARRPAVLELTQVQPEFDVPYLPMVFSIAVGVRRGDAHFSDLLNEAIAARWSEIQEVLRAYDVPRLPLPRPPSPAADD